MNQNLIHEDIVVPESAALKIEQKNKYGSVPGLDDEELAEPYELERQVRREEWEPILSIPSNNKQNNVWQIVDPSDGVGWGAFGTVDFERMRPKYDNSLCKAGKLQEKLKDVLIMLSIVKERLPGKAKYLVLKHLRMGIIELEHITNEEMKAIAKWYLRARRLRLQIRELREKSRTKRKKELEALVHT